MTHDTYDEDREGHGFATLALHHGQPLDSDHRARAPPIYLSSSFAFKSAEHGAKLFALQELGPIYTRIMNPTNHMLEYRIAKLEGSKCDLDGAHPSALVVSSGQAAQMHAMLTICQTGDNFLASSNLYGGTYSQFAHTFPGMGVKVKFFDCTKPEDIESLVDDNTKAVYIETIANPSYAVADFEAIARVCKKLELPLVVDNTFGMCGYVCRPLKFGANIVVESCTKWIGGHGTTIGGVIVDGNNFDWSVKKKDGTSKFPLLNDPCPAYHGLNFNEVFGPEGPFKCNMAFIFHARVIALRDMGGCQNPFGSFQLLMGLETLGLRGRAHCDNANRLAAHLESHPEVEWVSHPSLESHQSHNQAKTYFREGKFGSVLSFALKGDGKTRGAKFIDGVKLASHLANVGDAKTLVIHPASTTHQQLSAEEQDAAGVSPGMIRVSVGVEDYEDIVADFEQAIQQA
ncbi:O-acetylhomoserine (thiol)-lyase [Sphaeroforma arctica JP610]|uniref:O-acetylhomoserine (Thiol)-lyase n=1 Tax=Sphaeroforma arctica JP610 TaxID=667725 RepID=A0A0L0FMG9_9EUKA|nr:O-acetylhomoserine (thiol)-lyase [Sphaeroforma arctica JP610]KNC77686.1 O-acetylhomoserine (thiol)-lyase [Sphaeroforma arctica JP610]|eukprot:XP_014151588.1 O-acetylhomoserine (thiol)-lyase [Sphaeroforma arctica JP610]